MMNCPHCGTLNDDDAQFCENCGAQLRGTPPDGMATSTKVLIVAVIVLVGVLGFVSALLLSQNQTTPPPTR